MTATPSDLRRAITEATRADEPAIIAALRPEAALGALAEPTAARATALIERVRAERRAASGVDALMAEFSLSSQEGIALMCLAEALLRIPDRATADRLIRDKIGGGDWRAHLGHSPSLFVNAAAWGLLVTGRLVGTANESGLSRSLTRLIARGGEPIIRAGVDLAMRLLGKQFVLGETIAAALAAARAREKRGYRFSYDMLGEAALTADDAGRYRRDYETAIDAIGRAAGGLGPVEGPGISVKLSALHPRYSRAQRPRVMAELLPTVRALALRAADCRIGFNIDAEEADRLDLSLDLFEALAEDPALRWDGLGFVVQAYQKRAPFVIDWLAALARRAGRQIMVRLVKGAYWDTEIKRAQIEGLGYPVFTRKRHTDLCYLACARRLLAAQDAIHPQFATHNAHTVAALAEIGAGARWEYQCLHGMGETLYDRVVADPAYGRACRIYAPVGTHETLLAYLVRRLLENGANSSFVNRVVDSSVPIADLVAEPAPADGTPHPRIPPAREITLPDYLGARGIDLAGDTDLASLDAAMAEAGRRTWTAAPTIAAAPGAARPIRNPAIPTETVGHVRDATQADLDAAIASAAASSWTAVPVGTRADILEKAAALFEDHLPALMWLAVHEAGKTLPNALGDVREAVDFLRYYAARARADLAGAAPLGIIACISPWNFPLAIFTGQVAAALAAGNAVVAKPAEQTPLIAAEAVRLLHEADVPRDALVLVPGDGAVGAALVADARIAGVLFTGSNAAASAINRTLAPRGARLIAETGGLNALVVDSSALPEQAVSDVVTSAFDSAGQRCSALRLLCVQDDVADRIAAMLRGAMDELAIGDPSRLETDIGPVIDDEAAGRLRAHIEAMRPRARWLHQGRAPNDALFVPPTAIEIGAVADLPGEVFGPVLHVLRYRAETLPALIDAINAKGYGLTFGVHSRIDETIALASSRADAGNIYVNRSIIGAVVGVQPFGGRGLSGTGPKAGGPLYLSALVRDPPALPGQPAPLPELRAALSELDLTPTERTSLEGALDRDAAASPTTVTRHLPGPTGETNILLIEPRGTVGCLGETLPSLVRQVSAALAAGNDALVPEAARALTRLVPRVQYAPDILAAHVDVVLHDGPDAAAARARLADREGPIVRLVEPDPDGRYDPRWLITEKTVTTNTTAAGGNASLMTLAG